MLEIASWHVSRFQCYHVIRLSLTVRGKANMTVCAFFGFSQLGGLGSQVGQITVTLTFLVEVGAT